MSYNMGWPDVILRYTIMTVLVIAGGLLGQIWLMVLGLPFFLAAILGYCPIYGMFGINTCVDDHSHDHEAGEWAPKS